MHVHAMIKENKLGTQPKVKGLDRNAKWARKRLVCANLIQLYVLLLVSSLAE